MASGVSIPHALTRRYVTALLNAAQEQGRIQELGASLRDLLAMIRGSADLRRTLLSPQLNARVQQRALAALMSSAKLDDVLQGFVRVVLMNRRGAALETFLQAAVDELARRAGQLSADVDVAAPLNDLQQKRLSDMLSKWIGSRVDLNVRVTPDVLGGIKIRLGDVQIDDTVSGKLARLRQTLQGHAANG